MPHLHEILASIHKLDSLVAKSESWLASNPEDWDAAALVDINTKLLERRKRDFAEYIKTFKGDTVVYSVFSPKISAFSIPVMRNICTAFTSFETAVLLTAQAKLMDAPQRMRKLEKTVEAAALRYGYMKSDNPRHLAFVAATQGETQMELTLNDDTNQPLAAGDPRRLMRVPDRVLKEAANDIFSIAQSRDAKKLSDFSRKNGPAILVEVNDWCQSHRDSALDAEAIWGDSNQLMVTSHQMETLHYTLEKLSDDTRFETFELKGSFYAFNLKTRRFAFEGDDGTVIAGHVPANMFTSHKPAKLPKRYAVVFQKKTRFNEALGQSVTSYMVVSFEETK